MLANEPRPGAKYPISARILMRANKPLWNLTFDSLSSFGKIAAQASLTRDGLAESHPSDTQLSKLDVVLTFNIEVIVMEVRGLRNVSANREIYCTMEIEGSETGRLQTEHVLAKKPLWDTQGDFVTNHPLPVLKIKLYAVNPSMLSLEDKELGKLVLRPSVLSSKTPEWCSMSASNSSDRASKAAAGLADLTGASANACSGPNGSGGVGADGLSSSANCASACGGPGESGDQLKIRVIVRMDRPQQLKHCGFLYGVGKGAWRKFRRRYHILIQVSQYTFVMCDFRDKKSKPTEMLQLDGYTVDFIEPPTDLIMEHCSEIASGEHAHHHSSGASHLSAAATFGLAGRLAKPFLKQQQHHHHHHPHSQPSAAQHLLSSLGVGGAAQGSSGGGALGSDDSAASGADSGGVGGPANSSVAASAAAEYQMPSAIQTAAALSDELHNKFYFNVVREGDSVVFACDDEQECFGWVMALYRATGQAHKPTPLRDQYSSLSSSSHYIDAAFAYNAAVSQSAAAAAAAGAGSSSGAQMLKKAAAGGGPNGASLLSSMLNGTTGCGGASGSSASAGHLLLGAGSCGSSGVCVGGVGVSGSSSMLSKSSLDVANQRARKHGMDEFIAADPCKFQHNQLFKHLQQETLEFRLKERLLSLGWLAPGQLFVLDEYCARYGVRTCFRHLAYLNSLLDFNARGFFIDHTLINYGYDFCSSFVSGQSGQLNPMSSVNFDLRPDGTVGTVTVEERDLFHCVKQKLLKMIERQLANFSYCFPYGKPDGALKSMLSLLERVLMKQESAANQMSSMLQNDEVRSLIRKCLEQAALNDYTKLSGKANLQADAALPAGPSQEGRSQSPGGSPSPQEPFETGGLEAGGDLGQRQRRLRDQSSLSNASQASSVGTNSSSSGSFSDSFRRRTAQQAAGEQQQHHHQQQQQQQQHVTMAMVINNEQVRPQDKLRYLVRLAELCCEQVEESNEYFADAFAWHSDLMMEHFELFWSLFSVDMDKVLAELGALGGSTAGGLSQQQQTAVALPIATARGAIPQGAPPQTGGQADLLAINNRDVFALFQVLNNHMRKSANFECRKFKAYLCDTFKPKLLCYIDVMESTLTRMVFKACERDGQINVQLIEQIFVKLDELQAFVLKQLRWPDEQLAEQLHQRLKLIAYELCDATLQKTLQAFQQLERRSNKWTATTTSYNSPTEMIQMINLTLDTRSKSAKLCTFAGFDQMSYHFKIDKLVESALGEMQPGLMSKMLNALDSTLNKLARFDEGNLLAPILSLTYKQGMSSSGRDIGKQYVSFVSNCCDLIRQKINDELWIVALLEDWFAAQMGTICNWLAERIDRSLHDVQLVALTTIMPKVLADMSLQGVSEEKLNLKSYQTIMSRLKMEEAAGSLSGAGGGGAGGGLFEQQASSASSIFNSSLLSSLTSSSSAGSGGSAPQVAGGACGGQMQAAGVAGQGLAASVASASAAPMQLQQAQTGSAGDQRPGGLVASQLRGHSSSGGSFSGPASGGQANAGAGIQSRRLNQLSSEPSPPAEDQADNIADRALQSATRMFKGFWS